ncbi:AMP-binding protein [Yaniella halotolerans]|uniref:AMP-binding protein n=1 Tax=Yaniella halotolerans TaxID=225453 RepID=UPI0003B66C2F|nr:AMP-binding protein [Yaniella halotolerans]
MTSTSATTTTASPASYENLTPLAFLGRSAATFPEREAVIYGTLRRTYAQFEAEVQQLARALAKSVRPGQIVSFVAPNTPEMLAAHYAVPLIGAVLNPLNPRLAGREFGYIFEHAESEIVFVDSEVAGVVSDAAASLKNPPAVIELVDEQFGVEPTGQLPTYADFMSAAPEQTQQNTYGYEVANELDAITLNYTSGTTGPPKGVLYTHRGAYLSALGNTQHYRLDGASKYLWTLPMFHCNGWTMTWGATASASTHVCLRAVRQDAIWDAFDNEGITHLCGAPIVAASIIEAERARELAHPVRLITAASAPPPSVIEGLENLGIMPVHVYGLTETYGPATINEAQDHWADLTVTQRARQLARQGVPMLQNSQVSVVDPDGNQLPADGESQGEVVIRGNGVMAGYYKNPEATEEALAGGWFHTGDIGVQHPDGYIQLMDRLKDIIISGGENISSIEVEGVLHGHPDVSDAAVIGIADERWGERPVAYVVVTGSVTSDDLREHCRAELAGFKVPDAFHLIDELPRSSTGKIRKTELRDIAK